MDWDYVRVFLAVAREGSMRAAGRALGLSQPTIARRLAAFEATFGGPTLFDRLPEGLRLNGPVRAARRILYGQVRSGLSPGGRRIRTLGPPRRNLALRDCSI
jgi:DNA-binding transcriptional LysR family regulator